jgi:hypothetical protein
MNVANSVLWRMAIILEANKVNLFVSSVVFVFWYHSPNFLDTPRKLQTFLSNLLPTCTDSRRSEQLSFNNTRKISMKSPADAGVWDT